MLDTSNYQPATMSHVSACIKIRSVKDNCIVRHKQLYPATMSHVSACIKVRSVKDNYRPLHPATISHASAPNVTLTIMEFFTYCVLCSYTVQPLDNNFTTCVNIHNYEHFGRKGFACTTQILCTTRSRSPPTMHHIRLVIT